MRNGLSLDNTLNARKLRGRKLKSDNRRSDGRSIHRLNPVASATGLHSNPHRNRDLPDFHIRLHIIAIINDRTFVPVEFIEIAFGMTVIVSDFNILFIDGPALLDEGEIVFVDDEYEGQDSGIEIIE